VPPRAMLLCDVCDGAIPAGRKTYELKGGGTCCEACYQRLTARPAVFAIPAAPARSARTAPTRLKRYAKVSLGRRRTSGKAVASLVLGILSITSGFMCTGVILSALAMVFGTLALAEMKRNRAIEGRGLAQAGLIIGVITMLLGIVVIVLAIMGIITLFLFPGKL